MISLRVEILRLGGFRAFCKFIAKRRGTVDRGAGRKIAELENLAELNVAVPGGFGRTRDPQGPIDGFLLGLDLDKPVAGDEFLAWHLACLRVLAGFDDHHESHGCVSWRGLGSSRLSTS